MSVSLSPSQDSGWSLFDSHITGDNHLCGNCFTRLYEEHGSYDASELRKSLQGSLKDDVEKLNTASTEYHSTYSVSDSRTSHCRVCGSDSRCILKRPLLTEKVIEYGENLYYRLDEIDGVYVEKQDLLDVIRELKSEPENQGDGNWIFHEATRLAATVDFEELND